MGWRNRACDNEFPKGRQEKTTIERDGCPNDSSDEDEDGLLIAHIRRYYWNRLEIRYL
jgi:hypothetical protein